MRSIASYTSYGVGRFMSDAHVVSEYGATPEILVLLWRLLYRHLPSTSEPHHMLWWLYNCKHYPTKTLLEKALRVSAPTSRKAMTPVKEGFLKIRHQVVSSPCSKHRLFLFSFSHISIFRSVSKIDWKMIKAEHARSITMVLISSASTEETQRIRRNQSGDAIHLTLVTTVTNSKVLVFDMESALVFRLER